MENLFQLLFLKAVHNKKGSYKVMPARFLYQFWDRTKTYDEIRTHDFLLTRFLFNQLSYQAIIL